MSLHLLIRDQPVRSLALTNGSQTLVLRHTASLAKREGNDSNEALATNKSRCMVEFSNEVDLSSYRSMRPCMFAGTLGLINVGEDLFLCLIRDAVRVASPRPGETVQRIQSVDFYCLNKTDNDSDFVQNIGENADFPFGNGVQGSTHIEDSTLEHPCLEVKRMLSSGTFYYSNDFDLTNRLQDRIAEQSAFDIDNLDEEFLWSQYLIRPLIEFRSRLAVAARQALDQSKILTLAIRGFVSTISVPPSSLQRQRRTHQPAALTIISRLSCRRAGTRFNSRGIDDDGNVANFVETESIVWQPPSSCFSYVQTRGSVPLFWEQATGLLPGQQKIQLTRSAEATQPAFDRHFDRLEMAYGVVSILNLLSEARSGEADISERYRYHVKHSPLNAVLDPRSPSENRLLHTHFDFHAEAKAGSSVATSAIKKLASERTASIAYFASDSRAGTETGVGVEPDLIIKSRQAGIFRTNCLDCLDRTNLVQTILSQMAMELFFRHGDEAPFADFWTRHATLWADNGDALSKIYAGTGALKSSFTRHGKMSIAGALADARKSATRLYVNNFVDKGRQNTTDMLLGRLMEQSPVDLYDPVTDFVNAELKRRVTEYTSSEDIHIWAGTFNLNGKDAGLHRDLTSWLNPPMITSMQSPEIVVVGFQEIVELSPQQIMSTDPKRRREWEQSVSSALNAGSEDEFVLLRSGQLVGAALMVFVKRRVLHRIKNVEGSERKLGLSGIAGNKGAVAIRFDYGSTRLCFLTAHLAAGFANIEERNRDYNTISRGLRFQHNRSIEDHDAIIWAGDFNYRIGLGDDKVRQLIKAGDLDELYHNDQLNLQMVAGRIFQYYSEARITFLPTYKYENGTEEYDRSEKARIPAWCDRILHKGRILRQLNYSTAPLVFSDHRPVFAIFRCKVDLLDEAARQKLNLEIYRKRREDVGDTVVDGDDEEPDDDLIGYEAISSGLPPASSDRRKWWLDNDLPVRSGIARPEGNALSNDQRMSNPFKATRERLGASNNNQTQGAAEQKPSSEGMALFVENAQPQPKALYREPGTGDQGHSENERKQPSNDSSVGQQSYTKQQYTAVARKPVVPRKPYLLTLPHQNMPTSLQGHENTVSSDERRNIETARPLKAADDRHASFDDAAIFPDRLEMSTKLPSQSTLNPPNRAPNIIDDDLDAQSTIAEMAVLEPSRRALYGEPAQRGSRSS